MVFLRSLVHFIADVSYNSKNSPFCGLFRGISFTLDVRLSTEGAGKCQFFFGKIDCK